MCRRGLSYLLWRSNPLLLHTVLLVAGVPRSCDDTRLLGLTREELVSHSIEEGFQTTTGFLYPALSGSLEGGGEEMNQSQVQIFIGNK